MRLPRSGFLPAGYGAALVGIGAWTWWTATSKAPITNNLIVQDADPSRLAALLIG
jgi:hypothetical protein